MSETDLAKFLWTKQRLVYLRPVDAPDFELLDLLVMIKKEGFPLHRRPVLKQIGPIFDSAAGSITHPYHDAPPDLDQDEEDDDEEFHLEALKQELKSLRSRSPGGFDQETYNGKYLHTHFHGGWRFGAASSANVRVSAIDIAPAVGGRGGVGRGSLIHNVESESVNIPALSKCLSSETNQWAPNIDYIQRWCAPRNTSELELWVVTKLVYHRGLQLKNNREIEMQADVPGLPAKIGAGAMKNREVEIDLGRPSTGGVFSNRSPFAFQAIRLTYNVEDAQLVKPRLDMGRVQPIMRAHQEDIITDPDIEPDFNMSELLDMEAWESLAIEPSSSTDCQVEEARSK